MNGFRKIPFIEINCATLEINYEGMLTGLKVDSDSEFLICSLPLNKFYDI
eukprot:c44629_g1_i1 orf=187-336(+)